VPGHDRSVADRLVAAFSLRFEGRDDATDIEPDKLGFGNIQGTESTEARLVFETILQTNHFKYFVRRSALHNKLASVVAFFFNP
jgi:hypothetical protein